MKKIFEVSMPNRSFWRMVLAPRSIRICYLRQKKGQRQFKIISKNSQARFPTKKMHRMNSTSFLAEFAEDFPKKLNFFHLLQKKGISVLKKILFFFTKNFFSLNISEVHAQFFWMCPKKPRIMSFFWEKNFFIIICLFSRIFGSLL